jgi:serine/threonine-protein kinase
MEEASARPDPEPENTSSGVRPGDILAGKYRVERVLGEGGMGVVVAAHHIQLDERVALKFLLPSVLKNLETIGRFAREARAAVKIKSEHVARVIDVGELENGSPYIVMEYLEGVDLSAWLTERGPMSPEQAVGFVLQACEALAEAHALGIIHRDLKPANLFLANRPSGPPIVKVLDFGISKAPASASQPQLTKTAALVGSPLYMSPEQMHGSKTIDARSDIWSMGVVLYQLVSGKVPFPGEMIPEVITAVLYDAYEPLRSLRAELAPGLEAAVDRCLSKSAADRFGNVGELAAALAPFGPPRSDVSVERISHVLGLGMRQARPVTGSSPDVVIISRGDRSASGVTNTVPGAAPTSGPGTQPAEPAGLATGTTAKPVSSDASVARSAGAITRRSLVLPAVGVMGVLGLVGLGTWRMVSFPAAPVTASTVLGPSRSAPASAASDPADRPAVDPPTSSAASSSATDAPPRAPATAAATPASEDARAPTSVTKPAAAPPRPSQPAPPRAAGTTSASADPFGLNRK